MPRSDLSNRRKRQLLREKTNPLSVYKRNHPTAGLQPKLKRNSRPNRRSSPSPQEKPKATIRINYRDLPKFMKYRKTIIWAGNEIEIDWDDVSYSSDQPTFLIRRDIPHLTEFEPCLCLNVDECDDCYECDTCGHSIPATIAPEVNDTVFCPIIDCMTLCTMFYAGVKVEVYMRSPLN